MKKYKKKSPKIGNGGLVQLKRVDPTRQIWVKSWKKLKVQVDLWKLGLRSEKKRIHIVAFPKFVRGRRNVMYVYRDQRLDKFR